MSQPDPIRMAAVLNDIEAEILDGGHTVIGVFPSEDSAKIYHFGYTVGRAAIGLPELIVTGTSSMAAEFLNWIDERWDEQPGVNLEWLPSDIDDPDGRLMLIPVPDAIARQHATLAYRLFPDTTLQQAVWYDTEGWPWDKNDPTLPILDTHWEPPA